MASVHQIAVAKASLAAALLRPDPISVSRLEISRFHSLLDNTVLSCTSTNIENCTDWLSSHVLPSVGRLTATGKYLAALSASFGRPAANGASATTSSLPASAKGKPSIQRKRIHLLYLLNDFFHHAKYHTDSASTLGTLSSSFEPHLSGMITTTASFDTSRFPKHSKKIDDLLNLWTKHGYFNSHYLDTLRDAAQTAGGTNGNAGVAGVNTQSIPPGQTGTSSAEAPFIMPATHGDLNTPYYDLPAANMLPHIVPNSSTPITPSLMRPLQLVAGPADPRLANAVKEFLQDVDFMYDDNKDSTDEAIVLDVDQMGQPLIRDEISGDLVPLEAYYGWSIEFCEKMKRRKRGEPDEGEKRNGSRGRSGSSSRDGDTARKRRRYSSSADGRGRSDSRNGSGNRGDRGASRSYSPPLPPNSFAANPAFRATMSFEGQSIVTPAEQIDNPLNTMQPPPPGPSSASNFEHNFPVGPGGLPIPPPPPFHTGSWPPPPPNMPSGMSYNAAQYPNYSTMSFVPPPPPPFHSSAIPAWSGQSHSPMTPFGPGHPPPPPPPAPYGGQNATQPYPYGHMQRQEEGGRGRGQDRGQSRDGYQRPGQDPRRR